MNRIDGNDPAIPIVGQKKVHVTWSARTEKLDAQVPHALLVVPLDKPDDHSIYFDGSVEDLARMIVAVLNMSTKAFEGRAMLIAREIMKKGKGGGDFVRREPPPESSPP